MSRSHDSLPQSSSVSALVRRIVFKLNAELHFNGHAPLTDTERSALFELGDASRILDGVAVLPNMAQHENRARRDLLDLYDIFDHTLPSTPGLNAEERAAVEAAGDATGCLP